MPQSQKPQHRHTDVTRADISGDTGLSITKLRDSPLPDPAEMAAYKAVDPDLLRQIMDMVQSEQAQRH